MVEHLWSHEAHPAKGHPDERVLYDDCAACAEAAEAPGSLLDPDQLRVLWDAMRRIEFSAPTWPRGSAYRTRAEAKACGYMYEIAVVMAQLEVLPPGWRQEGLIPEDGEVITDTINQ